MVTPNKASDENPKKDRHEEYSASKIHVGDNIELDLRYFWLGRRRGPWGKKKRVGGSSANPDPAVLVLTFDSDHRELRDECAK